MLQLKCRPAPDAKQQACLSVFFQAPSRLWDHSECIVSLGRLLPVTGTVRTTMTIKMKMILA
eukprot:1957305-Amphidinium_carterae.1